MENYEERYKNFSIELDCAPGEIRPWHLIAAVLDETGLSEEDFETGTPFFGHQTWVLKPGSSEKDSLFTEKKPIFKERIASLFNEGLIRYGSW